jgi:hypothetical protein
LKGLSKSGKLVGIYSVFNIKIDFFADENLKPFMFELFVPVSEERYIFACPSDESKQRWVSSIEAVSKLPNVMSQSRRSSVASRSDTE